MTNNKVRVKGKRVTYLNLLMVLFLIVACETETAGTTTTAENGIHGVAKQSDGTPAKLGSEVQLKEEEQVSNTPSYNEVASTEIEEEGRFYMPSPDTGVFVLEVEQKIDDQTFIDRQRVYIESKDKAYTLDTLVLELAVRKRMRLFFETRKDEISEAWVGQVGTDRLTKVGDSTWITIVEYDPEETELVLFYKEFGSEEIREEYLWGIQPEDENIYIADFFEDNYQPIIDDLQECSDSCEWDPELELETCLGQGNSENFCENQVRSMIRYYQKLAHR